MFLQRMLKRHGSQEKVAERIGKSQMYVSNRLALVDLDPELRDAVDTKQLKVKTAERIAKIQDPEQQKAIAAEEIRKAQEAKAPRKRRTTPAGPPVQNPVLNPGTETKASSGGVAAAEAEATVVAVPELRTTTTSPTEAIALPWQDGEALMNAAFDRLDAQQRSACRTSEEGRGRRPPPPAQGLLGRHLLNIKASGPHQACVPSAPRTRPRMKAMTA